MIGYNVLVTHYSILGSSLHKSILSASPYRHLIHGPSPLNAAHLEFLPRLSAAIQVRQIEYYIQLNNKIR